MRGFLAGSLALIVLYVLVQPGTAGKAATGSSVLVSGLRRALSPQVAGVPDRSRGGVGKAAQNAGQAAGQVAGELNGAGQAVGAAGGAFLNQWLATHPTGN